MKALLLLTTMAINVRLQLPKPTSSLALMATARVQTLEAHPRAETAAADESGNEELKQLWALPFKMAADGTTLWPLMPKNLVRDQ
jgi:hypothetical protein